MDISTSVAWCPIIINEDEKPVQYAINCALCGMDIISKVFVREMFANCCINIYTILHCIILHGHSQMKTELIRL